ncbi:MAG: secretin N-terminal domain-containing protein [Opitutales bacterium]
MIERTTFTFFLAFWITTATAWAQVPAVNPPPPTPGPAALPPAVAPPPVAPSPSEPTDPVALPPSDPPATESIPFDYADIPGLDDEVGIIKLSDETWVQVLKMIEMYTGRNILPTQNVPKVAINFDSGRPLSKGEALIALESLLSLNGIALTKINARFWKAVPTISINNQVPIWMDGSPRLQPSSEKIYTKLFQINYLPVKDIMTNLGEFGSKSFKAVQFEKANTLLVTDSLLNLQRMEKLIENLDRQVDMISEKIFFIKLVHVNVNDVQRRLSTMSEGSLKRYLGGNTKFDADERTGQLIVVTHVANEMLIRQIIENLDIRVEPDTSSKLFDIKNADAVDVQKLLAEIIGAQKKVQQQAQKKSGGVTPPRTTAATTKPAAATGKPAAPTPKGAAGTGADASERNLQFSEFVTTVADPRSNSILAYGTKSDLAYIEELINQIDIQLPQVKIEVIITEVTLTHNETRGLDIFRAALDLRPDPVKFPASDSLHNRTAAIVTQDALTLGTRQGNFYFDMILDIAKNDGRVEVLSTPNIVATHNREAEINVSQAEPIVTGINSDSTGTNYRSNIQYRDIGIQLKVKPLIGSNGVIQMEIQQTVENVVGRIDVDQQNQNQPIIGKRSATSYVAVRDREVVVLAGLQESKPSKTIRRTPILGSIPILQHFFTRTIIEDTKRDLIFFIRPEIVGGSSTLEDTIQRLNINDDLKDAIRSGDIIPSEASQDEKDSKDKGETPDAHSKLPGQKVVRIDL